MEARFFVSVDGGDNKLFGSYDFDTDKREQYISNAELESIRSKTTKNIAAAASEMAMQNPNSGLFKLN